MSNPDAVCRSCHQAIYDRYERTPMARGSGAARDGLDAAELGAKDLVHGPSGVTYHVSLRGEQAYLAYSRPASAGAGALEGERKLELFVGSGRRGRTFLYEQEGLWFEAPINWYGKKKLWDMAPAYSKATAMPAPLPVDANCLHCHAGNVQASVGAARNRYAGAPFQSGGVGCAACHGDPSAHLVAVAHTAAATLGSPRYGPIVNPDKLTPSRRDSACLQCHLEGDAAVYLPGKSLTAFRPGEELSASVVYFVDQSKAELGSRASSQYEALLRSACKRASGDRMTCTTCHDPHSSPAPAERVAFFRAKCLACHTGTGFEAEHHPEQKDCAVCHMPTRPTLDISHEQLTDHDIEARPNGGPVLSDLAHASAAELVPVGKAGASDRELGLGYAQLAQRGDRVSGERALKLLLAVEKAGPVDPEVLDQLGFLLQRSGDAAGAADRYAAVLRVRPGDVTAAANLAVLDAGQGRVQEAVGLLRTAVREDPAQTAAGLNLAFLQCRLGEKREALGTIQQVLRFNPDSPAAREMLRTGSYGGQVCSVR